MPTNISKVNVNKDGVTIEFASSEVQKDGSIAEKSSSETIKRQPSESFVDALRKLIPHLLFSTELAVIDHFNEEWFDSHEFLDDKRFERVIVTGFKVIGEQEGVKLIGRKVTKKGDVTSLVSPIIYFEEESENAYQLRRMLSTHFDDALLEAKEFKKGKYAPVDQLQLFEQN